MIPPLDKKGFLPPGVHKATLKEIKIKFGTSSRSRKALFNGLQKALKNLRIAGVKKVYINGSFVTIEENPRDIDGCWDVSDYIDEKILDPVLLDFSANRKSMKIKYGVDFFIANNIERGSGYPFLKFFQISRDGEQKGILLIDLGGEFRD